MSPPTSPRSFRLLGALERESRPADGQAAAEAIEALL
jgi:hypothetical protein